MNGIQSSLYTIAAALCLFSAGVIGGKRTVTGRSAAWFTGFLALETLGFTLDLLVGLPAVPYKALWLGLRMATSLFLGPCLWLVFQESVTGKSLSFARIGRRQMFVIALGVVSTFPVIGSAHPGPEFYDPRYAVDAWYSRFIHTTMLLCMATFAAQVPWFLQRCRRLLLDRAKTQTADGRLALGTSAWLHLPLVIVFATWSVGILRTFQCASHASPEIGMLISLFDVSVTVGAMYLIVRRISGGETSPNASPAETRADPAAIPDRIAAPPSAAERPAEASVAAAPLLDEKPAHPRYARSTLPAGLRRRISEKLEAIMAEQFLYRESLLSLRSLSARVAEKPHYVSQVINQDLGLGFYEYVNRHRIEEAKSLLLKNPGETVLEIALAVGFNSKSTFNAAFRVHAGVTPREFRAAVGRTKLPTTDGIGASSA